MKKILSILLLISYFGIAQQPGTLLKPSAINGYTTNGKVLVTASQGTITGVPTWTPISSITSTVVPTLQQVVTQSNIINDGTFLQSSPDGFYKIDLDEDAAGMTIGNPSSGNTIVFDITSTKIAAGTNIDLAAGSVTKNSVEIATTTGVETLTNKTLTNPIITATTNPTYSEGTIFYNSTDKCLSVYDDIPNTSIEVGQEMVVRARNNTGSTINNGQVVYISGALGQNPTIALAKADAEATSLTIGVATHSIANNTIGKITTGGIVKDLNLSAFSDGDALFLSQTTAGSLTNVAPSSPNFVVPVGIVAHSHVTQGKLHVRTDMPIASNTVISNSNRVAPTSNAVKVNLDYLKGAVINTNQFRLTLTSGVPVTTGDVVNAQTIYCSPYSGNVIGLYSGSAWGLYTSSEFSLSISSLSTGMYDVFCYSNSGTPTLETQIWTSVTTRSVSLAYQDGILVKSGTATRRFIGTFYNQGNKTSTVTITNASPCVITYTGHGLTANAPITFTTTGGLPTGIIAGQTYYLASIGAAGTNTFNISATPGGALINTSSAGSGTHTASVASYLEDSKNNRYLWNYNNQVNKKLFAFDNEASHVYTTATYRQYSNNQLNQLNFIQGLDNLITATFKTRVLNSSANVAVIVGIGLDYSNASGANASTLNIPTTASNPTTLSTTFDDYTGIGKHYLAAIELSQASGATTWNSASGVYMSIYGYILC